MSARKKSNLKEDYNNFDVSINDNFQIVQQDPQNKVVEEIRNNRIEKFNTCQNVGGWKFNSIFN